MTLPDFAFRLFFSGAAALLVVSFFGMATVGSRRAQFVAKWAASISGAAAFAGLLTFIWTVGA